MQQILIIDDTKTIAALFKDNLESALNFETRWAPSFAETERLLNARDADFHVAIVDLNLPDAPNGEVVDYVISKNVPAIVLTGDFSDDTRERIWAKNVVDYVLKEGMHNLDYIITLIKRLQKNKTTKVLVVDDANVSRTLVSNLLKIHLYDVFVAKDGKEALEILDKNPDIRLIITDCYMPKMDGFQLSGEVRKRYSKEQLAIIGMSAKGSNTMSARFIKSGANDFLQKPFIKEEFYCRVSQNVTMLEHFSELRESEERFRKLFENASDGIFIADVESEKIISANKRMLDMTDYKLNELKKNDLNALFNDSDLKKIIKSYLMLKSKGGSDPVEVVVKKKDETTVFSEITATSVNLHNELYLVGILRDITERRRAENERGQRERLQGVVELAGAACHEINQPLQVISGYTELLMSSTENTQKMTKSYKIIYSQIKRLSEITLRLQNVTKYKTMDYLDGKIIDIYKSS
ncbi:response regulator [candidate division KSB1 bacterium]